MKNRFNFYVSKHDHELLEHLNNYGNGFNQYICNLIKRDISTNVTLEDIMSKLNEMQGYTPQQSQINTIQTESEKNVVKNFEFNDNLYDFSSDDF